MLPQHQIQANVYVNGSKIPSAATVALPDISVQTVDFASLGTSGSVAIPTNGDVEAMSMTIRPVSNVKELEKGLTYNKLADIEIRVALQSFDQSSAQVKPFGRNITVRGMRLSRGSDEVERRRDSGPEYVISIFYYRETLDGEVLHEIDPLNTVFIHNGEDVLADVRALI